MYPQDRCVYVPTRDPTSRADFEQVDELWTHVTTTTKFWPMKMDVILVSCKAHWGKLWAVSCTHRVDVSMCQPGTQRHARILNKWMNYGPLWPQLISTCNLIILVSYKTHWAMIWAVSCTHRVGVSMCQPGTQRHARILNYGPMWPQLLNSDLWRWMSFLWVAKRTEASSELFHVPTG